MIPGTNGNIWGPGPFYGFKPYYPGPSDIPASLRRALAAPIAAAVATKVCTTCKKPGHNKRTCVADNATV